MRHAISHLALLAAGLAFLALASGSARGDISPAAASQQAGSAPVMSCANAPPVCQCGGCKKNFYQASDCPAQFPDTGSCNGSYVDNIAFDHHHIAFDYRLAPPAGGGCPSCGGGMEGADDRTQLPTLVIERRHRHREAWLWSSLGPGVFLNFDTKLLLSRDPGSSLGSGTVTLFDMQLARDLVYRETSPIYNDDTVDGIYWEDGIVAAQDLRLFDAGGHLTTDQSRTVTARLRTQDGRAFVFEVIRTSADPASPARDGRLTRVEDRNGNAIVVAYRFAAAASDTALGNDRTRLWQMASVTDAYGRGATFTYGAQQVLGRWVVKRIDLPNGQNVGYVYGARGLESASHADGTVSTFTWSSDDVAQCDVLRYRDAAAEGMHRNKEACLSRTTWVDPADPKHVLSQSAGLLRMLKNGAGEVSYLAWQDPADFQLLYVYEGGDKLKRHKSATFYPVTDSVAQSFTLALTPMATWEKTYDYGATGQHLIQNKYDVLGRLHQYLYHVPQQAITSASHPDGTFETTTYNAFKEPLLYTDRIGRKTQYTYDDKGNLLTKTAALGTPDEATWHFTYNARGQLATATDANGNVTTYTYSPTGDLIGVSEPRDTPASSVAVWRQSFDNAGHRVTTTDPNGRLVTYRYDVRNRPTTITYPDATTETFSYGAGIDANLLIDKKDRNGNIEHYIHDVQGRETSDTHAFGLPEEVTRTCTYRYGTNLQESCADRGNLTTYEYDYRQRLIRTAVKPTAATSLISTTTFDEARRVSFTTDPYGRRRYYVYDVNDRAVREVRELVPGGVADPVHLATLGRDFTPNPPYLIDDISYDAEGQVVQRIDPRGIVTKSTYDQQGRLVATVEALGTPAEATTKLTYDPQGNRLTITNPRGYVTATSYTGRNLPGTVTEAQGTPVAAATSSSYTLTKKRSGVTDPRGLITKYGYDPCCDRLISITDPRGFVTTMTYDANGNLGSTTDPNGNTISMAYDGLDRMKTRTNGEDEKTGYIYDDNPTDGAGLDGDPTYKPQFAGLGLGAGAVGSAVLVTDPLLHSRLAIFDGMARSIRWVDANGNATTTQYDAVVDSLVETAVTDPLGHVTRDRADGARRVRIHLDALLASTQLSYDANGNQVGLRDPNNTGDDRAYDSRNRETSRTDTAGSTYSAAYDLNGNAIADTDARGSSSTSVYDERDRKTSMTDRIGGKTRYAHDPDNNLVAITDAEGGTTSYAYDARNLLVTQTLPPPAGGTRSYAYDPGRRLLTRTDEAGAKTTYLYDHADRLQQRSYPDNLNDTLRYDQAGRLTAVASARYGNTVSRIYDKADRMTSETQSIAGNSFVVKYEYDAANRQTALTYPAGSVVSRGYTERDQLASVSYAGAPVASLAYDAGMRRISTSYGNGLNESRTYRQDNRLTSLAVPGVTGFGFTYDGNKNPLTKSNSVNTADSQSYTYDVDDRLTTFTRSNGDTQSWNLSLEGDWNQLTRNGLVETRTLNAVHELVSRQGALYDPALKYDAMGNLTDDGEGRTFTWDFENHMQSATVAGNVAQYGYDALWRRVTKTVGGQTTVYVYDGWRAIAEYAGGAGPASPTRSFVFGDELDEAVMAAAGGHRYFYHANDLLSVHGLTDENGTLVEAYRYDPYGKPLVMTGSGPDGKWFSGDEPVANASAVGNPYLYTGQRADSETGLFYYKRRYYSPVEGRFIGRDPLGYVDGLNLYEYVADSPTNHTDPEGLQAKAKKYTVVVQCSCKFTCCGKTRDAKGEADIATGTFSPTGQPPTLAGLALSGAILQVVLANALGGKQAVWDLRTSQACREALSNLNFGNWGNRCELAATGAGAGKTFGGLNQNNRSGSWSLGSTFVPLVGSNVTATGTCTATIVVK